MQQVAATAATAAATAALAGISYALHPGIKRFAWLDRRCCSWAGAGEAGRAGTRAAAHTPLEHSLAACTSPRPWGPATAGLPGLRGSALGLGLSTVTLPLLPLLRLLRLLLLLRLRLLVRYNSRLGMWASAAPGCSGLM